MSENSQYVNIKLGKNKKKLNRYAKSIDGQRFDINNI